MGSTKVESLVDLWACAAQRRLAAQGSYEAAADAESRAHAALVRVMDRRAGRPLILPGNQVLTLEPHARKCVIQDADRAADLWVDPATGQEVEIGSAVVPAVAEAATDVPLNEEERAEAMSSAWEMSRHGA